MSSFKQKYDLKTLVIFFGNLALFLTLLHTLPFAPEANKGLALLVFIAILWLTEIIHVTVTALLIPVLAIILDLTTSYQAFSKFSDPIIFLFLGGFALSTALNHQQLDRLIANKIMLLAKGKFLIAVMYLFVVTAFLSMWISNTATAAMMLPLAMGILSKMDRQKEHNTYMFVLLGIAYSASIGGMGTLIGSPPNAIAASQLGIGFAEWMMYGFPVMLLLLPIMVGALYITFRPKLTQKFEFEFETIQWNSSRIMTLIIFIAVACGWVFSSHLNPWLSELFGLTHNIANFDSVVAVCGALALCLSKVTNWSQIQNNTEWGVLILFGGGLTLSSLLSSTGASKIMADGIAELISGQHYFIICVIIAAFIVLLTEFTSNTASAALLVPIFISIAEVLNMSPLGFALIIGLGASCAFMLPVGTPPNAIVFGTGLVKQSDMLKSYKLDLTCIIIIATIGYLFWL